MKIKTLSATAIDTYENCPAWYRVIYSGERVQDLAASAADLGTACHESLELSVKPYVGQTPPEIPFEILKQHFEPAYWKLFADRSRYDEGLGMLKKWQARQDWTGITVLHTEQKMSFPVKSSAGEIPFNYIWDRCDKLDNYDGTFDIRVIDYKSYASPVQADDLRHRIQPGAYAVAARILYPEARRIRVVFDLLRYDLVGRVFTHDESVATYRYLSAVAERILADTNAFERICSDCRWCLRRNVCTALKRHMAVGGALSITDPVEAAQRRAEVDDQIKGLYAVKQDLDDFLLDHMKENDLLEVEGEGVIASVGISKKRVVDAERISQILPPDLFARYGSMSMTMKNVDELLKGTELTDDQKDDIRAMIQTQYGEPAIRIKKKSPQP